ncbi:MAG TPA: ABC transporter ATP-binding protein [Rhodothermales bacterium]|nr:ABC transporter ATP-binding protein [Rhodothermales bacterium]
MLRLDGVSSGYGDVAILKDISFEVAGDIFAVLGANGAGKSTLTRTIARILPLMGGRLFFKGEDVSSLPPHRLAQRGLALVPQEQNVFPDLTVRENLSIGGLIGGRSHKEREDEVLELFPSIVDRIDQKAGSLSGGEAQMVAVARALMQDPDLILLDEPTAGLAPKYVAQFFGKLREIHSRKGVGIVLAEQNAVKALEVAGQVMVLSVGEVFLNKPRGEVDLDMVKTGYRI